MAPANDTMHKFLVESVKNELGIEQMVDAGFVKFDLQEEMVPVLESQKYPSAKIGDKHNRDLTREVLRALQIHINRLKNT